MIRGLLEKEFRQHGVAFGFLLAVPVAADLLLAQSHRFTQLTGTSLESLHITVLFFSPLVCFLLNQILISGEFRNRTQLFLEGLPLPRWRMIAVKYVLGALVALAAIGIAFAASLWKSAQKDALTWMFSGILASRCVAWTLFAFGIFFALAFLGRYRIPIGVLSILGLILAGERGIPVSRFCAFQLIDPRFSYERINYPGAEVGQTLAFAAGFAVLGFWLGLMRDATVAALLAERMSARERLALTFVCFGAVMGMAYISAEHNNALPVSLPGAYEVDRGPAHVAAAPAVDMPSAAENAAARRIAEAVATDLQAVASYLGCSTMPAVFIVHRRDFEKNRFENGDLKMTQGLMVRANLTAADFDEKLLHRWIVHEVLIVKSSGRANLEKNAWVLDGFPLWWEETRGSQPSVAGQSTQLTEARAAMPGEFSVDSLKTWYGVRKAAGNDKSRALAWSGLSLLAARHGADDCQRFLAAMLGRDVSKDARGWLREVFHPMAAQFHRTTGMELKAFVAEWQAALKSDPPSGAPTAGNP